MSALVLGQARRFVVVGAVGFLVDGGILTALVNGLGWLVLPARFVSFSVAVTVTWLLNRRITFADRQSDNAVGEWGRYALVNGVGALLNLAIFFVLVLLSDAMAAWPIVPLAFAAGIALVYNFFASRQLVFRGGES